MNNSGTISVELKLLLDSLRKQAKEAAAVLQSALKGSTTDQSAGATGAKKKQDEVTEAVKKTTKALKDQKQAAYEAWKASLPKPVVTISGQNTYGKAGPGAFVGPVMGGGLATQGGANAGAGRSAQGFPSSMPVPPGFKPGLAPAVAAVTAQAAGQSKLMVAAQMGAALAGLRVAMGLVSHGLYALATPLRVASASAEGARRMYAKQLQSGMGAGFTVKRSLIADALGVGEDDVLRYGAAVGVLNGKMAFAAKTISDTTPYLTATGWKMKEFQANFAAASAQFGVTFKGLIDWVLDQANRIPKFAASELGRIGHQMELTKWADKHGVSANEGVGGDGKRRDLFFRDGKYLGDAMSDKMTKLFNKDKDKNKDKAPPATSFSARMQNSPWEKMGLVLGAGGSNHAQQTAQNTKRIATLMESLVGTQRGTPAPLNKSLTSKL